jgi:hypothetical protein
MIATTILKTIAGKIKGSRSHTPCKPGQHDGSRMYRCKDYANNVFLHLNSRTIFILMEADKSTEPDGVKIKTYQYDCSGQLIYPQPHAIIMGRKENIHMPDDFILIAQPINPEKDYRTYEQSCTLIAKKIAKAAVSRHIDDMPDGASVRFFTQINMERLEQLIRPEHVFYHHESKTIFIVMKTALNMELPTTMLKAYSFYENNPRITANPNLSITEENGYLYITCNNHKTLPIEDFQSIGSALKAAEVKDDYSKYEQECDAYVKQVAQLLFLTN